MSDEPKKPAIAVALDYEEGTRAAPVVVATGRGLIAEKIIEVARESGITIEANPMLAEALMDYKAQLKVEPSVIIVKTPGACQTVERNLKQQNIAVDVFQFAGDYYSLPNLVPLLARPSRLELLLEIMDYPLPRRKAG